VFRHYTVLGTSNTQVVRIVGEKDEEYVEAYLSVQGMLQTYTTQTTNQSDWVK